MANNEYLYRVTNKTPGAPDRFVIARLPGQALNFVAKDMLSAELCDGIAGAEAVMRGHAIERAIPASTDTAPEPQQSLIPAPAPTGRDESASAPAVEEYPEPGPEDQL